MFKLEIELGSGTVGLGIGIKTSRETKKTVAHYVYFNELPESYKVGQTLSENDERRHEVRILTPTIDALNSIRGALDKIEIAILRDQVEAEQEERYASGEDERPATIEDMSESLKKSTTLRGNND